jgi:hypothetical protein
LFFRNVYKEIKLKYNMAKKVVTRTITKTVTKAAKKRRKKAAKKTKSSDVTKEQIKGLEKRDALLIENFVGLQKAMTNLSVKFSELSGNLNTLLGIFEAAAKTLAESEKQVDKTLTTKLDTLLEQNKTISREINMVDGKMRRAKSPTPPQKAPALYSRQIQTPQAAGAIPPKQLPKI